METSRTKMKLTAKRQDILNRIQYFNAIEAYCGAFTGFRATAPKLDNKPDSPS